MKNIFYLYNINSIGGIETFFYNLALKYGKDHDITVFYQFADPAQIERLSQYVRCVRFTGQHIKCEKAFFNLNLDIIDNVEADEYIQIIHGDYVAMKITPNHSDKITRYIGISEAVCESFYELTGNEIELCYNPVRPLNLKKKEIVNFVTLTRIDHVKGLPRMVRLSEIFDNAGINWHWTIYSDQRPTSYNPRLEWRAATLDIESALAGADYLIQLSDAEGYCYSVVEALQMGIGVIVTDLKVFHELGIEDGVNGFFVDKNLTNVPVEKIAKKLKKFTYTPPADRWDELLAPGKGDYLENMKKIISVHIVRIYEDMILGRTVKPGETLAVSAQRAQKLTSMGLAEYINKEDANV